MTSTLHDPRAQATRPSFQRNTKATILCIKSYSSLHRSTSLSHLSLHQLFSHLLNQRYAKAATLSMNPCATTFRPGSSAPERGLGNSRVEGEPPRPKSSACPSLLQPQQIKSPKLVAQQNTEQYDLMFPCLPPSKSSQKPQLDQKDTSKSQSERQPDSVVPQMKETADGGDEPTKSTEYTTSSASSKGDDGLASSTGQADLKSIHRGEFFVTGPSLPPTPRPDYSQFCEQVKAPIGSRMYPNPIKYWTRNIAAGYASQTLPSSVGSISLYRTQAYTAYPPYLGIGSTLPYPSAYYQGYAAYSGFENQNKPLGIPLLTPPTQSSHQRTLLTTESRSFPQLDFSKHSLLPGLAVDNGESSMPIEAAPVSQLESRTEAVTGQPRVAAPESSAVKPKWKLISPAPSEVSCRNLRQGSARPNGHENSRSPTLSEASCQIPSGPRVQGLSRTCSNSRQDSRHPRRSRTGGPSIRADSGHVDTQEYSKSHELLLQQHTEHGNTALRSQSPPSNAPTGPALRRHPPTMSNVTAVTPGTESGAWSQSKRWVSLENKGRLTFQKMMVNLHYMGADKSPFVPQTPAELTAFRAEMAKTQRRKLAGEVVRRIAENQLKKQRMLGSDQATLPSPQLFRGRSVGDHLSPVFAAENCFNRTLCDDDKFRVEWPCLAELKEDGDKRAAHYGRCFPLPRMNLIASQIVDQDYQEAFNPDGSIRWEKKAVKLGSRDLLPVSSDDEASLVPVVELLSHDLPALLQSLIHHINTEDNGVDTEEHDEEEPPKQLGKREIGESGKDLTALGK